ncbi:hypothetical protein F9L33_09710 [Amylibacter sp. SFDW26]|uniref:hypothetical protein n=1 Tax=Amylibacter sp. SFDW26 TaxID=2652722 RepID=UPI0012614924|nr:hypothetical protein [Amylibacter sp. SFDW26]KAB7613643.1 hypothetical protein F9L33_09710 [Amylibacter sp. SFDW26]
MDINLYIGAHNTSTNAIISILENNDALLSEQRIHFASSKVAIQHLAAAQKALVDGTRLETVQQKFISAMTNGKNIDRLVIISPNILGTATRPFGKEVFYPRTSGLMQQLQNMFQGLNMKLFFSVRNPSDFIPLCYSESLLGASFGSFENFTQEVELTNLRWSSLLHRLQGKQDENHVTIWRHEDYPSMWRDVIQLLTGVKNNQMLKGSSAVPTENLSLNGARLFNRYVEEHPPRTKEDFANMKAAFLQKFPETSEPVKDVYWDAEVIQTLTDNYDDDWYYIERMEGIRTIQPRIFA